MRPLELFLIICSILCLLQSFSILQLSRKNEKIVFLVSIIILVLHFAIEGVRWQMVFIYCMIVSLVLGYLFHFQSANKSIKWGAFSFCIIGILISLALSYMLPIFTIPKTTGTFQVGSLVKITDKGLRYKIFSPIKPSAFANKKLPYLDKSVTLDGIMGMPSFVFNHLKLVKSNSIITKETNQFKEPLVIYSHGANSSFIDNTALLEEITSQGYVVVALDHDFSFDQYTIDSKEVRKLDINVQKRLINQLVNRVVPAQVNHYHQVIEHLKSLYSSIIDFENIVLIEHSLGGATASNGALKIENVKGVINMDGPIDNKTSSNYKIPLLYLSSFSPNLSDEELKNLRVAPTFYRGVKKYELESVEKLFSQNTNEKFWVRFKNANHLDFTDMPYIFPLMSGPNYEKERGHELKSQIVTSFLNRELKGSNEDFFISDKSIQWIKKGN